MIDHDEAHAAPHGLGAVVAHDHDDRPIDVPGPSTEALALVHRASPTRLAARIAIVALLAITAATAAFRVNAWYEDKQARAAPMVRVEGGNQPAFEIDRREIAVRDYALCVARKRCTPPPRGDECNFREPHAEAQPVTCVQRDQAAAYCAWVKKRLPTEEEKQRAAHEGIHDEGGFRCAR